MRPISTGVWRIACGDRWLRNFNGEIVVGPGKSEGDRDLMWRLDFIDEERKDYTITNVLTGVNAFSSPPRMDLVVPGPPAKWTITPAGANEFHIQWPNEDLYWTVHDEYRHAAGIMLKSLEGKPEQVWKFEWVGDR